MYYLLDMIKVNIFVLTFCIISNKYKDFYHQSLNNW